MVRRKADPSENGTPRRHIEKSKTHFLVSGNRKRRRLTRVLQEIRYLRKSVNLLIPKAPFTRLVREIIQEFFPRQGIERIQLSALEALQESAEAYIVQFFQDCLLLAMHAKRVTLQRQDMLLMRRLRGRDDVINK